MIPIGVVLAVAGIVAIVSNRNDDGDRQLSLRQIACETLVDHDAEFTYSFVKDIAEDHPYTFPNADLAARQAMTMAQAGNCS